MTTQEFIYEVEQRIMTELAELKKLLVAQSPNVQEREWFNPREVAKMFGVKDTTVRNTWIKAGKLMAEKTLTGHLRVHIEELYRFANDTGRSFKHLEQLS